MQNPEKRKLCPLCDVREVEAETSLTRRRFLAAAGGVAAAAAGVGALPRSLIAATEESAIAAGSAESHVKHLYDSLKAEQRKALCFPFDHPLRRKVANNWHIVPQKIGEFLGSDQQEIVRQILRGITTEDGYERFQKQMKDDHGGLENYACALFGEPGTGKFQWVFTGRHVTLRADGDSVANAAFGGPIFYGHAVTFNEKPDHPGNVWWHQARLANKVYQALDGKQQKKALLAEAPPDEQSSVVLRGRGAEIPGLAGSEMSRDQKELLESTLKSLLEMFREADVKEVLECLKKNGGIDEARVSFFKEGDIGADGIWDIWRVEGPTFVWFFRGSPHVHTWVNVGHRGPERV